MLLMREAAQGAATTAVRPVYLNMRFLAQPLSGMQRYAEELSLALDTLLAEDPGLLGGARVIGLVPKGQARSRDWRAIEIRRIGRLKGHAWEQTELAREARDGVLVSLAGSGPVIHPRHVVALHDANPIVNPQFFSSPFRLVHGVLRPGLVRRAAALLTVSVFSQRELARLCGVPESRFKVIPDSAEHILGVGADPGTLARYGLEPGRYALCVGNQSPNKNIALAIDAFARLSTEGMRLAVAGGTAAALKRAETVTAPWLSTLGRVSDGELRALYENAAVFVFPSIYEGFGVPPLEAMALGCPVVSSDSSAMPEVLGDAALFFRSGDVADCAERFREVLEMGPDRRRCLVEAGRARAARYNWRASAKILGATLCALEVA
jgi:glycosyltransferase involved in cell wall biosynthesis